MTISDNPTTIPEPAVEPEPAAAAPALPNAVVVDELADALRAGHPLTVEQREQLADLAAFAGFARDWIYPLVVNLQPLAARVRAIGPELQNMGPMQLLQMLRQE